MKKIPFEPLVSIIINCYNGEKFLEKSIRSVFKQTHPNWEIIFFNNNSKDNSEKIIKKFSDRRIRYFCSNKTYNLYKARNIAISKSRGEYICFLDTDDIWLKDKLKIQLEYFRINKSCKILYSNYYNFFNEEKRKVIKFNKHLRFNNDTQSLINNYTIGILTVMIKRQIFKNFFFKNFLNIIGDFEYFIRLSQKFKIDYINKPLAIYRIHNSNFSKKKINIYIKELNNWIKLEKKKKTNNNLNYLKLNIFIYKLKFKYCLNLLGV